MANRRNAFYALLIVFLVAGALTERAFFFHLSYALVALLVGSFLWSWTAVNFMRLGRYTQARRAQVGRTLEESFAVHNTSILPKLWLEVRDHSDLPNHNASHVVPALLPRQHYRWDVRTLCTRRGQYTLGPITVLSGDPFGLFQFPRKIAAVSSIIVYPPTVPVHRFATPVGTLSGGEAVRRRAHFITTNAAGVRDYEPGDSFNRIHWRSTARKDRLLVKEFELDPLADVWIILDLSRESLVERPEARANGAAIFAPPPNLPPSTEEYGVTIAASLTAYFVEKGRALGFVTYVPHREIVQPDRGPRQLTRILEILAVARSASSLTLNQLLSLESGHLARGTTLVLISATQADDWIAEVDTLQRRGIRVIPVLIDPISFGAPRRSAHHLSELIENTGATVYIIRQDDDLTAALSYRTGFKARIV